MNAVTTSTGGLSFSVAGAGVSVDPATGIFRILTDALRDGVEISITASNSAGAATTRFRLSVVPEPEAPDLVAPVLITPPSFAGTGRIGDAVELDPGVWGGTPTPEVSVEWRRDGVAISGADGLVYVPGPEDDLADLTARVTATNAAGSASAEAGPLDIVWPAPAVVAELADLVLVQGPGGATAEAGAAFAGSALVFAVTGAGASADPASGRLSIPTDQPLTAAQITVTASNSGGSAAAGFRVTVAPALAAPVLVVPPSLAGDGTVDSEIVLDPGTWAGVPDPEVAVQWLREDAAIDGANGPVYVPGPADDSKVLRCRVTARNAAGSAEAETAALEITRAAPVAGALADLDLALGSGPQQVEAAAAFTGEALAYAVTGAGASIDAATGRISIPTDAAVAGAQVTVTASNSGGAAAVSFRVTVAIAWPADIPASLWPVTEITDPAEAAAAGYAGQVGHLKVVFGGGIDPAPAGFTLRHDVRGPATPNPIPQLPQVAAGTTVITTGVVSVGDTAYPRLYWRHTATDTFRIASEHVPVVIQGLKVAAPVAVGVLPDEVLDQGSGAQTVPTAFAFSGADLRYAVTGAGASIDAATGVVSVPTGSAVDGARVTVTASNAGGSVALSFLVTVEAEIPASGGLPLQPQAQVNAAIARPLTYYGGDAPGSGIGPTNDGNAAFWAPPYVVEALASFSGNTSADPRLLQNLKDTVSGGREPRAAGGYPTQHETQFVVAAALAKLTPRIWNQLTTAEKTRIDLAVKGCIVCAAYTSGVNNFEIQAGTSRIKNIVANEHYWKTGAPNFRIAPIGVMLAGRVFMGSASAVTSYLNGFDKAAFAATCKAQGLSNLYETYRTDGAAGSMGARPTTAQVQSGIKNWAFARNGQSALAFDNTQALVEEVVNVVFARTIAAGLNGSAGITVSGVARARIINNAAGLPNLGQSGMATELDYSDAEGDRSSMSYSMWGIRCFFYTMVLAAATGLVDRKAAWVQALLPKMTRGMTDFKYKSDNGYRSYAHAGSGAGNEDWTEAKQSAPWGWSYNFGLWFDVLKPWLDGK